MISVWWLNSDNRRSCPLIACLLNDDSIECPDDLSTLLRFIYPANDEYTHYRIYTHHQRERGLFGRDEHIRTQEPIFWLLDRHLNGPWSGPTALSKNPEWVMRRLQLLVEHHVNFNISGNYHQGCFEEPPLYIAIVKMRSEYIARFMLEKWADIHYEEENYPILCDCIKLWEDGHSRMIKFALENKSNPDQYDDHDGLTALILAIKYGRHETVIDLLWHGADPLLGSRAREDLFEERYTIETTPLEMACRMGFYDDLYALFQYIDAFRCNHAPYHQLLRRPILLAAAEGHLECLEGCLRKCTAGTGDTRDEEKVKALLFRALYVACKKGQSNIIMYLIKWIIQ
jgi:Ankyrin repeats (3 copies)